MAETSGLHGAGYLMPTGCLFAGLCRVHGSLQPLCEKRPPEPYKGKGIKYSDEHIRRKEGKAGKK